MKYYRVFGLNDKEASAHELLSWARNHEGTAQAKFRSDDRGWFEAELVFPESEQRWHISRFMADEEGIRRELGTWAAWLEAQQDNPYHAVLMKDMIATRQIFTIEHSEEDEDRTGSERLAELCRHLAQITAGVYQVDGRGFFSADGTLLVEEPEE